MRLPCRQVQQKLMALLVSGVRVQRKAFFVTHSRLQLRFCEQAYQYICQRLLLNIRTDT